MKQKRLSIRKNQEGLISIVIAILIILVMTLIVLAMARNANREQRQAIDRQLSDQAFYNAESGVNDAAYYIHNNINNENLPLKWDKCDPLPSAGLSVPPADNKLDADGINQYTCLMYDRAPPTLEYANLSLSEPKVVPIRPTEGAVSNLTISWDNSNPNANIEGPCDFSGGSPELPASCDFGGVRVELINPSGNPALTRDQLQKRGFISYLLPSKSGSGNVAVSANQGLIAAAKCDGNPGPRKCSISITGINLSSFYLVIRSLYQPTDVSISGKDTDGGVVQFKNAQVIVDSTGKANDVLRRIQVRVPSQSQFDYPGFSIQSRESICKLIDVLRNDVGVLEAKTQPDCPIPNP